MKKPKTLYKAIQQAAEDDDLEDLLSMSPEQIDAEIRAHGGDPEKIRAAGEKLAKQLIDRNARLAWHEAAHKANAALAETAAALAARPKLSRDDLVKKIDAARNDPRFKGPVTMMFRDRSLEQSSDEELDALLQQIELLALSGEKDS